jgi:hypothetical protein
MVAVAATPPPPQPVYILLYSRFYDHSHQHTTDERLQRLLPLIERLRNQYPQSGLSALFQFSGTVSEVLRSENEGLHLVDQVKDFSRRGLVGVGYTGEDEPSYLYRPKATLLPSYTPEQRWAAKAEAAERFLTDYKNPVTGLPIPGLSGGLKRTLEIFGSVSFLTGITQKLGGDSPAVNEARKMVPDALMGGIPGSDSRRGIEGFGFSAANFSMNMSPEADESPEVYWEDNVLRLSDTSLTDNKPHTTDEDLDKLKKVFSQLDRTHVRVIKLEVASYRRYVARRADGSAIADPMEWMYYHPDEPVIPLNITALVQQGDVEAGYQRDEATLKWLLQEFLPANPGSRFLSVRELAQMAAPLDEQVTASQVRELAADFIERYRQSPQSPPNFVRSGSQFFSLAEAFNVMVQSLAGAGKQGGSLPVSVALTPMYGPLTIPNTMGPTAGTATVAEVIQAASAMAPKLRHTEWKRVPDNAVPITVLAGKEEVDAAQFLLLMAQACLDPSPDRILHFNAMTLSTQAGFMFPKNTIMTEQSNSWTFKPAPLRTQQFAGLPLP